jgi:hypothetical protein
VASEVRRIENAYDAEVGGGGAGESEEEEESDSDEEGLMAKPFTNFSGWRGSFGEAKEKMLLVADNLKKAISPKIKKTKDGNGDEGKSARTSSKIESKTPTATSNKSSEKTGKTESEKKGGEGDAVLVVADDSDEEEGGGGAGSDGGDDAAGASEGAGKGWHMSDSYSDCSDPDDFQELPEAIETAAMQTTTESNDENNNDGSEGGGGEGDGGGRRVILNGLRHCCNTYVTCRPRSMLSRSG